MARTTFRFRLEQLLGIRVMREKQERSKLLALRIKVQEQEAALALLVAETDALIERMTIPSGETFDVVERLMCERYLVVKRREQAAQQIRVQQAEAAVVAQQAVVSQAGIDVKALERLKERQQEEHRLEQLHEEAVFLDDLAGQQFIRNFAKDNEDDEVAGMETA